MTRTGWKSSCPDYVLRLEQLTSVYRAPLLLGVRSLAASLAKGSNGGTQQKKVQWWNDWGAINPHYIRSRTRSSGSRYTAARKETGSMNELVLRNEQGGQVIKRADITKFDFTADELYKLTGLDRFSLPKSIRRYSSYELVIRNTVILPEAGEYVFKFQVDYTFNASNQAWHQSSRRRHTKFHVRAGASPATGQGGALATFSARQGSATKSVSFKATQAGTVPFEASIMTQYLAPGDKMVLPNSVTMTMKRVDSLHGASLGIGSATKYMSDLDAIRGDTDVRIDWPERDDPLSSELKTQTFQALPPQALLIGSKNMAGFHALAEAKIDAGACTSVEAWAEGVNKQSSNTNDFLGVALNLCDVDGNNQFLELVTYHPASVKAANMTKRVVGWVHVGFTQPTHMRIVRDPLNLGNFDVSYRPDNRARFATPFATLKSGFTGKMEVGVSMNSAEAYRYSEFYNISIDECSSSCKDASGKQLFCGKFVTPCGNTLDCGKTCGTANDVCQENMCMACPPLGLTADQQKWDCGTIDSHCTNHKNQKIQISRDVGKRARPTTQHFCGKSHQWACAATSKWSFLAQGKECGTATDSCQNQVQLFSCMNKNDQCDANKCKCTPTTFNQKYDCGSEADGCGTNVAFGRNGGTCPKTTDRCLSHICCSPKTRSDFSADFKCGKEPDVCGGFVSFAQAAPAGFFKKPPTRTSGQWHNGQKGIEITARVDSTVVKLARGMMTGATKLIETSRVSIFDVATKKELGFVDIGPDATVSGGYAWAALPTAVTIKKGSKYRIVQRLWYRIKDKYSQSYLHGASLSDMYESRVASFHGEVSTRITTPGGYPEDTYISRGRGAGLVNFDVLENEGCGAGMWTCNKDHSCTKIVQKGFKVQSGNCEILGDCVTSPGFGKNHYRNSERCTIQTPSEGVMKVKSYNTERGWDYLTVDGKKYKSSTPPIQTLTAPKTFTWYSDGSVTNSGWKVCVEPSSLLQEDEEKLESDEKEHEELDDAGLAELSEEERQHALGKYKQQREEDAAEAAEAAAFDKEMEAAEAMPVSGDEMEPGMLEHEPISGDEMEPSLLEAELDADELSLPDLTQQTDLTQ